MLFIIHHVGNVTFKLNRLHYFSLYRYVPMIHMSPIIEAKLRQAFFHFLWNKALKPITPQVPYHWMTLFCIQRNFPLHALPFLALNCKKISNLSSLTFCRYWGQKRVNSLSNMICSPCLCCCNCCPSSAFTLLTAASNGWRGVNILVQRTGMKPWLQLMWQFSPWMSVTFDKWMLLHCLLTGN